jgi:hypothetical protein
MEIISVGVEILVRTDSLTYEGADRHNEIMAFRDFAQAPEMLTMRT